MKQQQARAGDTVIDDVINALAGPMRTHGLVIVPHVVEHETVPVTVGGKPWTETRIVVEYDVYGPDGSSLPRPVRVFAVGLDNADDHVRVEVSPTGTAPWVELARHAGPRRRPPAPRGFR